MAPPKTINWAIYNGLPPMEAEYQLAHVRDDKRISIAIAYIICFPTILLAISMRFVSRRIGHIKYGADDWTMLLGLAMVAAAMIPDMLGVFVYGGARHVILMTEENIPKFAKCAYAAQAASAPPIGAIKISTLLLYARIFPDHKFRRTLWAVGLFITIYSAITVLTVLFQCRPIRGTWDSNIKADCIDLSKPWIVTASLNVVTDFLTVCLPLPQLWKLQMRRETKLQLIGIFSIGSFATIISIYRIPQLRGLSRKSHDPTWSEVGSSIWGIVEISAITLGACAITYRPLITWIFNIQPPLAAFTVRPKLVRAIKQIGTNGRTAPPSDVDSDTSLQAFGNLQSPLSSLPLHSSRIVGTDDGFRRIRDSTDV